MYIPLMPKLRTAYIKLLEEEARRKMRVYNIDEKLDPITIIDSIADAIEDRNMLFDAVTLRKASREVEHAMANFSPLVKALELILSSVNKDSRYPRRLKIIEVVEEALINAKNEEARNDCENESF